MSPFGLCTLGRWFLSVPVLAVMFSPTMLGLYGGSFTPEGFWQTFLGVISVFALFVVQMVFAVLFGTVLHIIWEHDDSNDDDWWDSSGGF